MDGVAIDIVAGRRPEAGGGVVTRPIIGATREIVDAEGRRKQALHEQRYLPPWEKREVVRIIRVEQDGRADDIARVGQIAERRVPLARHLSDCRQDDQLDLGMVLQQPLGDHVMRVLAFLWHREIGDVDVAPQHGRELLLELRRADPGAQPRIADHGDVDRGLVEHGTLVSPHRAELDRGEQLLVTRIGIVRQQQGGGVECQKAEHEQREERPCARSARSFSLVADCLHASLLPA